MRSSVALLLAVLAFLVACESDSPAPTTVVETVTSTTVPVEPVSLAHSFRVGETFAYQVDLTRRLVLSTEGDPDAPLDDLPSSADVSVTASGVVELEVTEVTSAGHHLLLTESLEVVTEGTVDDEPLEGASGLEALGDTMALPDEVTVDERGLLGETNPLFGLLLVPGPFTAWTGFLGPVLPAGEVILGEEWSDEVSVGDEITDVTGRLTGSDVRDGAEVVTLEGRSITPEDDVDLTEFYADFLGSFEGNGEVEAQLRLQREALAESWQALFDPAAGRLLESTATTSTVLRVDGVAPDPATGEATTFGIRLEVEDALESRAVASSE